MNWLAGFLQSAVSLTIAWWQAIPTLNVLFLQLFHIVHLSPAFQTVALPIRDRVIHSTFHLSTPQKSTPRRYLLPQWSCLPMEVHPPNCQASQILPDLLPGFLRSKMVMDLLFIGALPTINWRLWCVSRNFSNFCGLMKWSMMNYTCIYRIWGKCSSLLLETSLRSTVSKGPCFCELLVVKVGWRFTIIVGNPIWKALSFLSPPRIL